MTEIKHKAKRLVATLLGLMMALVLLAPSAFAADGSASIVVTLPEVTDVDMLGITVTPYLVLDQVNDTETDASKKQYEVTEGFKGFFAHEDNPTGEGFTSELATVFANAAKTGATVYLTYDADQKKLVASTTVPPAGTKSIAIQNATSLDATYPEAALLSKITDANNLITLYSWVEKYITAKSIQPATPGSSANSGSAITLSGLNEGYYALLFANTPSAVTINQGILIATSNDSASKGIKLKSETVPLEKVVRNPDHGTEDEKPFQENTTADVGDELPYNINTKIPTLANTENLTIFRLEDTMENQKLTGTMTLTLTKEGQEDVVFTATLPNDASKVTYFTNASGNIAKLTITNYGPVKVDPDDPTKEANRQSFTVDFLPKKADDPSAVEDDITAPLTNYQGYNVKLSYTATVTADAVQVNGNDVKLYINNNDQPLEDRTEVYTYGIDVQKKFSDSGNQYGFVTFSLYTNAEYQKEQGKTALTLYGQNGSYKATGTGIGTTELALNSTTGKLTITGLDQGTYWLVETATAGGYTKSADIQIVLTADSQNKAVLDPNGTTAMIGGTGKDLSSITSEANTSINLAAFEVLNQKGFNLPQTGGAGTWMFTIGGILLVAAAGVLFALSRKKDRSK